ncbi:MAG: NUDIX domain-containing protein [Candidatus Thermoplasmatota archaeon]|nr:NUDIX domain-containing protein [Candidatus Thermoplasmatota archaeon]
MSDGEPWVVVWAVPKRPLDVPCWLMVNHIDRGWELPGGKITEGESFDITALRELFEETGVLGTATDYDKNIIPKGIVVRVEIDEEPQPYGWESEDEKITEVGWCVELPGELYWGEDELNRLLNHDWSASSSLSS